MESEVLSRDVGALLAVLFRRGILNRGYESADGSAGQFHRSSWADLLGRWRD